LLSAGLFTSYRKTSCTAVTVRQDGRAVHDVFLYEVKSPAESKGPYDYYKLGHGKLSAGPDRGANS
jgi:hypothetical protein